MKLSVKAKRWLLTAHILFSAIMFGNMVTFLILSITVASTNDGNLIESCYRIMHVLSSTSVKASTIATIITGILLSVLTKWGLFQFYWLIVKEVLTLMPLGLNLWGMYYWTMDAFRIMQTSQDRAALFMVQTELWSGIIIQMLSLILIFVLSVFKPWGKRHAASRS
ncbi:hypothetical protein [Virgibacillus siamensis]|uniref:hypothetical protein n=1 Tax=Virgibacillus siamensis TaxID=480071 RepID=UPI00098425DF|nr:hypothetical protein [Virgibacillus siamensis]